MGIHRGGQEGIQIGILLGVPEGGPDGVQMGSRKESLEGFRKGSRKGFRQESSKGFRKGSKQGVQVLYQTIDWFLVSIHRTRFPLTLLNAILQYMGNVQLSLFFTAQILNITAQLMKQVLRTLSVVECWKAIPNSYMLLHGPECNSGLI